LIDEEIRGLVDTAEGKAREILTTHRDKLEAIAKALLEFESLSGDDVQAILRGEKPKRDETPKAPPPRAGARSTVPPTEGKGKDAPDGLAPEPQPGS
jgi:cell division protease FtsH